MWPARKDSLRRQEGHVTPVVKRSARGILIDDESRLLLIKRTRPGEPPYWTAPGGGVDESDRSPQDAMHRELSEELGATAKDGEQVFLFSSPSRAGVAVQHFFACRLVGLDLTDRNGPEFDDPARGGYDLDRVDLTDDSLAGVDLKPPALKQFIIANRDALLAAAGLNSG